MDLTDTPDVRDPDERRPDFSDWKDPKSLLKEKPIRERLLDVVLQIREPTKVSTIADRAECDPETAREYLEWFAEIGIVRAYSGRPVRYERNQSYYRWRRIERIQTEYSEDEIVAALEDALAERAEYRERFDADSPDDVSLLTVDEEDVEETWDALTEWKTVEKRAALLDAARRSGSKSTSRGRIDA